MKIPKIPVMLVSAIAMSFIAAAQGFFQPPAGGSGIDISGTWRYGGHQDSAYGTAAGALVDYGGVPPDTGRRLFELAPPAPPPPMRHRPCARVGITPPLF